MVKIISISVSDEHKRILDDMELSPSGLFKQKMEEVKASSINYQNKLNDLLLNIRKMQDMLGKYTEKYGVLE